MGHGYGYPPGYGAELPVPQGQAPQYPPWPTIGGSTGASLSPFTGVPVMDASNPNIFYQQTPVSEPRPWLPYTRDNSAGFFVRWYQIGLSNGTANAESVQLLQVDIPGFIFEMTGAAADTNGNALPVGMNSLDTFLVRLDHSNRADRLITNAMLGSAALGTAQFPAKVGLPGWKFNRGSTALFGITPLRANLRIDICVKYLEIHMGANFSSLG